MRLGLASLALIACSCAGTSAVPLSESARSQSAVFYVENHGADDRELEKIIAAALRSRGLDASSGHLGTRPDNADFIVSYTDRWSWDMRTFLYKITIEIADAGTRKIVATSESYQDSMSAMGKTFEQIVQTTTHNLLDGAD